MLHLESLSADQRHVVDALAVVCAPVSRSDVARILRERGVGQGTGSGKPGEGARLTSKVVSALVDDLDVDGPDGCTVAPEVRARALAELVERGEYDAWVEAVQCAMPRGRAGEWREKVCLLQANLLRGEIDPVVAFVRNDARGLDALAAAIPEAWRLAPLMPGPSGALVIRVELDRALESWSEMGELVELARAYAADDRLLALSLAAVECARGELELAEALVQPHREVASIADPVTGLLRLARGDVDGAVEAFDRGALALRKATRSRRVVPLDEPYDALHALALARRGDVDLNRATQAPTLVAELEKYVSGTQQKRRLWWNGKSPWEALALCLAHTFSGNEAEAAKLANDLREQAKRVGFALIAEVCADVVGRPRGRAPTSSWVRAMEPPAAWRRKLDQLTELVEGPAAADPSSEAPMERLVFAVEGRNGHPSVEARLQSRRTGTWSKGRKVATQRLVEDPPVALSPEDQQVVRHVHVETRYDYRGYPETIAYFDDGVIHALTKHPRVVRADDGSPLTLRLRRPMLEVTRDDAGMLLRLVPSAPKIEDLGATMEVVRFDEAASKVASIVETGLQVPPEGVEALGAILGRLTAKVPLVSDPQVALEGVEAQAVDVVLRARLRREAQTSLSYAIVVTPLGEGGPAYEPGRGPAQITADGATFRRDLSAERASFDAWRDALEQSGVPAAEAGLAEGAEAALALLDACRAHDVVLEWPEGEPLRLQRVEARHLRFGLAGAAEWLRLEGGAKLDDGLVLDMRALLSSECARDGYVVLDDGAIAVLERGLRRSLASLAAFADADGDGVHRSVLLTLEELGLEPKLDRSVKRTLAEVQRALHEPVVVPLALDAELRGYQREGFEWLVRRARLGVGACLADDMGLGKTVQALALLLERAADGPALVVAPTSVVQGWVEQAVRFAPSLRLRVLEAATAREERDAILRDAAAFDVVVTTWGLLAREHGRQPERPAEGAKRRGVEAREPDMLTGVEWSAVVLDEAQAMKNAQTRRAKAAMALRARARFALSGTPVENRVDELWSLFGFLQPGLLGTEQHFRATFAEPIAKGDEAAREALRARVAPFLLRRMKRDVLRELPPRTEIRLDVRPSKEQAALIEATRREGLERVEQAGPRRARVEVLAALTKLRLACCHPRLVVDEREIDSAKTQVFLELVDELRAAGHRALVFSQFVRHLALVREELDARGVSYQYLDGATSVRDRRAAIDAFQGGAGDLFLISLKAGGTGLNLTAADYVVHLDPWWNPAVEDQATDRAHRIGQTRPVTVYRLVLEGSVEQRILELHEQKRELADAILAGEGAALDFDMLRSLLAGPRDIACPSHRSGF